MTAIPPGANPAIEKLRLWLLAWIDGVIARSPEQFRDGLRRLREEIANPLSTIPADLIGMALAAVSAAWMAGDFGPATGSDADTA